MKLIRQLLFGAALCVACHDFADGQTTRIPSPLPQHETVSFGIVPRISRLPALFPGSLTGDGAFAGWHRADVKLAPDHLDDGAWGSGKGTKLPPWRLLPKAAGGWTLTGLMEVGATANSDDPSNRFNGPQTFNDRNDVELNQFYLSLQRAPPVHEHSFSWGGRIDLLFGMDYVFVQSVGLETQPDGDNALNGQTSGNQNPDLYGLAMPQAFVDLTYDQFNLRLGHFYTIVGYEGVAPISNFFYSHSYALQYGEPLTHTGGLLRWSHGQLTVLGGIVNGWDKTDAVNDAPAFLGGITYVQGLSTLGLSVISGEEDGVTASGQRTLYSLVWQMAINDQLAYVLQHDLGHQQDGLASNIDAQWYGVSQYLFYAVSDSWKFGVRYEWFRDDDGARLSQIYARNGGLGLPAAGFAGSYHNATLGANWTPTPNLFVRPEMRWDWSQGTDFAPFNDFSSDSQLTFAVDAVYVF